MTRERCLAASTSCMITTFELGLPLGQAEAGHMKHRSKLRHVQLSANCIERYMGLLCIPGPSRST